MAFETREQVLEKVIAQDKPDCPHCGETMSLWEVPMMTMDDGLGWGTPFLYVCFNDECTLYESGWKNIEENYGRRASYRCMCYPDSGTYECMPVWGPQGGQGQIIDDEVMRERKRRDEKTEKGLAVLAECLVSEDKVTVQRILLDPAEPPRVRLKAAEVMGDVGDTVSIDALKENKYGNDILRKGVEEAINKIHERHYTRECPFCAEIVKKRANVCKHCGKDVAGE
jgi:ribosomal protein L37AE/L43A